MLSRYAGLTSALAVHGLVLAVAFNSTSRVSAPEGRPRPTLIEIPEPVTALASLVPGRSRRVERLRGDALPVAPVLATSNLDENTPPARELLATGEASASSRDSRRSSLLSRLSSENSIAGVGLATGEATPPSLRRPLEPEFPPRLWAAGTSGWVLVEYVVDTLGGVEPGSLVVVTATDAQFGGAVRTALLNARFLSARYDDRSACGCVSDSRSVRNRPSTSATPTRRYISRPRTPDHAQPLCGRGRRPASCSGHAQCFARSGGPANPSVIVLSSSSYAR